ncbi:MAG: type III polyketide synthase [Bacteroidota bacterium]
MAGYITHIANTHPEHRYQQDDIRVEMQQRVATTDLERRIINRIYGRSGIESRYSVLGNFLSSQPDDLYATTGTQTATTGERNRLYEENARKLFLKTGQVLLDQSGLDPEAITHLITVSCTGFYAPGPDYDLIKGLGLAAETERYHLGFMGCYASISGLKMASRICAGDPSATVMVISTELCTLHFQGGTDPDDLISSSVFADGSAGAIVTAARPDTGTVLKLNDFASILTKKGADEMAWTIGDTGFRMVLSTYIPDLLSENLSPFLAPLFERFDLDMDEIDLWAVHPGGRRILDRMEQELELEPDQLGFSRSVLKQYGNMSSVTTLIVLKEMLADDSIIPQANLLALAFGPGLTIESGWMQRVQAGGSVA